MNNIEIKIAIMMNPCNYLEDDKSGLCRNTCTACKCEFLGHKARTVCRMCKMKLQDCDEESLQQLPEGLRRNNATPKTTSV